MKTRTGNKNFILKVLATLITVMMLPCLFALFFASEKIDAKADEIGQEYIIHSVDEFVAYSKAYAAGDRTTKDTLKISINSVDVISDGRFISIGTAEQPFAGTINIPSNGIDVFNLFNCPLFDHVSTDMTITGSGVVKIIRQKASTTPDTGVITSGALFANHVHKGTNPANWNVVLLPYVGENEIDTLEKSATSFDCLIGDIEDEAEVSVSFTNTTNLNVDSPSGDAGLICGTLGEGASISVETTEITAALLEDLDLDGLGLTFNDLTVTSSNQNAGGLVGTMLDGATLELASENYSRVKTVAAPKGYSGGIVGNAIDPVVSFKTGVSSYSFYDGTVISGKICGGLFGHYYISAAETTVFPIEDYVFPTTTPMEISATSNAGGVFGFVESSCPQLEFDGKAEAPYNKVFSFKLSGGANRGGIMGRYYSSSLSNSLLVYNLAITVNSTHTNSAGGVIGRVNDDPAYIKIYDVTSTSANSPSAGLIAALGSGGSFVEVQNVVINGKFDAGLIADMPDGVLRIKGTTDFSTYVQDSAASGLIVKSRKRALIYALGDGKNVEGEWFLKRNTNNTIDDVAGWGEVLRVDENILCESDLFDVDLTTHTVKINGAETTMADVTDFALTALNIWLNTGTTETGALRFTSGSQHQSANLLAGTLTLSDDIDLAGTGIISLTRDDGGNAAFGGEFDGGGNTLTLAVGEVYGTGINGVALNPATVDKDSNQGKIYRHTNIGIFAEIDGADIHDLVVAGYMRIYQSEASVLASAVTAFATGANTFTDVTVSDTAFSLEYRSRGNTEFCFGGAIGKAMGNGLDVTIEDCTFRPKVVDITASGTARGKISYIGGAIGYVSAVGYIRETEDDDAHTQSISFEGATVLGLDYEKTVDSTRESYFGGAIAEIGNAPYVKDERTVYFENTVEIDITANGAAAGDNFGAILGSKWLAVDVTIENLTIVAEITVNACDDATHFGALTQIATGKWDIRAITVTTADFVIPDNGSSFGFVANMTYTEQEVVLSAKSSIYPTNALYLDIVYEDYDIAALAFKDPSDTSSSFDPDFAYFDEIVGTSKTTSPTLIDNGNSVISITTSEIDDPTTVAVDSVNMIDTSGSAFNTYLNKTAYGRSASGRINPNTRYYYNLAYARTHTATDKYNFLVWSVGVYAHGSLSAWFVADNTFTGSLDMTGLSYYPIDFNGVAEFNDVTIKLDNATMDASVKYAYRYNDDGLQTSATRSTVTSGNQHYLMHTALFRNLKGTIDVDTATICGNVPDLSTNVSTFCGFFVASTLGGNNEVKAKLTLSSITFDGVYISQNGAKITGTGYAPLFINKVGKNTTINWNGAWQDSDAYSSFTSNYAASSLIGDVGDNTAVAIYLTFNGFMFDARKYTTSITAGGNDTDLTKYNDAYGTSKSIFSRATMLESFRYFNECFGSYSFTITEDWTSTLAAPHVVTYGHELTSSVEYAGEQEKYSGSNYYVHPTVYQSESAYDFAAESGGNDLFLRYVHVARPEDAAGDDRFKHEISVNVTLSGDIEGCGKYDDPYKIQNDTDLPNISQIISGQSLGSLSGVKLWLPDDYASCVYTNEAAEDDYSKSQYTFGDLTAGEVAAVREYLAGAYYVITTQSNTITLPTNYISLGTATDYEKYAFRGVIVGRGNPTIINKSANPLIQASNGCVVKDVIVQVGILDQEVPANSVAVGITLASPAADDAYAYSGGINSYGAVISKIMGGDTIIDNVQVDYQNASFTITSADASHYERLTPIGGYVGVIVNGGLIFRNMSASNVGLTSSTCALVAQDSGYLYVNPIIGRVIAGYAFHEKSGDYNATESEVTLKNGLKNYTISDLDPSSANKLTVSRSDGTFLIEIPDGQAMFVLGAIVNSGAACATYHATNVEEYESLDHFWSAYRAYTTSRADATYGFVGDPTSGYEDDLDRAANDTYSNDGAKIPYVIRVYTNKYTQNSANVYAARCITKSTTNKIVVSGDCDVAQGFRGIGSIYNNSDYVHLAISSMTGRKRNPENQSLYIDKSYEITLHMRYLEYNHTIFLNRSTNEISTNYVGYASASNNAGTAGFGLFNRLDVTSANTNNSVQYLKLSGSVFYDVYTIAGVQTAYNFASYFDDKDRTETGRIREAENTDDAVQRRSLLSVGGLAGYVNKQFYIKNVTFNDLEVEGAKTAGGLIGLVYQSNSYVSKIIYDNANITNEGYINVIGGLQAGGLIGRIFRAPIEINGVNNGTDIIIKDVQSKNTNPHETNLKYYANLNTGVGGLVGTCWAADGDGNEKPEIVRDVKGATQVRRLYVNNINVVKGTDAANVWVDNYDADHTDETKNNYAGGFIGSAHNVWIKLENCKLSNVNVTANVAGGFVGKVTQKYYLDIKGCTANGCTAESGDKAAITGTRYAGGAVGWAIGRDSLYFQLLNFTIENYKVESAAVGKVQAGAGGAVGYAQGDNKDIDLAENCICEFNNITVRACDIITNYLNPTDSETLRYKCGTGGIMGVIDTAMDGNESSRTPNNKYKFSGYNILVERCTLTHKNAGSSDDNTSATNRKIGDIVGNNAILSPIKFIGVSVRNATYCGKHVGYYGDTSDHYGSGGEYGTGYFVFADFNAAGDNVTTFGGVDDSSTTADDYTNVDSGVPSAPYVTVNPMIDLGCSFYDGVESNDESGAYVLCEQVYATIKINGNYYRPYKDEDGEVSRFDLTASGTKPLILTGDGVAQAGDGNTAIENLPIQNILGDTTGIYGYSANAAYSGSISSTNKEIFSGYANKFVMFKDEVSGYNGNDFPVLIIDSLDRDVTHQKINSYLRLLTNTTHDFGDDGDGEYAVVIYNMVYVDGHFIPSSKEASLKRSDVDNKFYMSNSSFDSGKVQFSLIDVRFFDAFDGETVAYHLYVPVFVKKILSYSFDIAALGGTDYLSGSYESEYGKPLIENVGTPLTMYFKYSYSWSASEWESAINEGENVNRNYDKTLMFYKANTSENISHLPASTVLVLVDANRGGKPYYATVGTAFNSSTNALSLSAFQESISSSGVLSGATFAPKKLYEMMILSVTTLGGGADKLVECNDINDATVVVSGQGYRLATDGEYADGSVTKYTVQVSDTNFVGESLNKRLVERYYLSVFTESNAVNDRLFHYYIITSPSSFGDAEYPSKIEDTGAHTMFHLIMGKIFDHGGFAVTSDALISNDPEMTYTGSNNSLIISLTSQIGISTDLDASIQNDLTTFIDGATIYQSFLVYLNRKEGVNVSKVILGDPDVENASYAIDYVLDGEITGAITPTAYATIRQTQNYVELVTGDISDNFENGKFEINAVFTLTYDSEAAIQEQFPGRGFNSPDSGVTVSGASNIAFSSEVTTYSKNSVTGAEDGMTYYSAAQPVIAVLDLNPIGDKVGDYTPLGINANNNDGATSATFDLLGVIDSTSIVDQITNYNSATVTFRLLQKDNAGEYVSVDDISDYFSVTLEGVNALSVVDTDEYYSVNVLKTNENFFDNGAYITLPVMHFTVNTGTALQDNDLWFSNYKIIVEVVLVKSNGTEIDASRVSDFIIYTNARINPAFLQ